MTALAPITGTNPLQIYSQLTAQGVPPSELRELLLLTREHEQNEAVKAYSVAVTAFQQKCPPIHKSRSVNAGPLKYQYASFDDVMRVAGPILAECGIALSFSTEATDRGIRVTCRMRVGIHAEDSTLDVPIPDMRVNDTQKYGAALSYAKRYALCAALNIVVTDEDTDAQGLAQTITEEQAIRLGELIDSKQVNPKRFMSWASDAARTKVEKLGDMPAALYGQAVEFLNRK